MTADLLTMLLIGHVLDKLAELPAESVHCVITSPPYWGLRDYKLPPVVWPDGWSGHLGLEPTPYLYIEHMVEVFREVRRVLRKDGTLWLNMGDSYAGGGNGGGGSFAKDGIRVARPGADKNVAARTGNRGVGGVLKVKDLVGMPWRLALALQADGWWLRSDIIWSKPNPMPESCRDRPTSAHEHIFLLAKAATYFYDAEAVQEPLAPASIQRIQQENFDNQTGGPKDYAVTGQNVSRSARKALENLKAKHSGRTPSGWNVNHDESNLKGRYAQGGKQWPGIGPQHAAARNRGEKYEPMATHAGRNQRNVWTIATQSFMFELCLACKTLYRKGWRGLNMHIDDDGTKHAICRICQEWDSWLSHFATFPEEIPKRAILAGTSAKGCCPECGAPWVRAVEKEFVPQPDVSPERGKRNAAGNKSMDHRKDGDRPRGSNNTTTAGWRPTCDHPGDPIPCIVLDPFAGSGTTGKVAAELGRGYVLIELSEEYAELIRERTKTTMGLGL